MRTFIKDIAENLNAFCSNHLQDLKKTMITKTSMHRTKTSKFEKHKPTTHEIKNQTIKDLVFVMSEVSTYLENGDPLNQSK